ncbi:ATP-binding cassette domain-containing protein [Streptococcus dentiloxodontae]
MMTANQLTFEHICFKYKENTEQLFTNLDVTMYTGQVVGILGASGSGKTTLTEILLGKLKPTCHQFRILENGKPITGDSKAWSYVPQKNLLRDYLKVSESFAFYADHHLKGVSKKEKKQRIALIMEDLGLTPFANKKVSELSGGQQRRVSIGIELLSPSPYFILDEPSSGLDALSDRNLLRTLKILAQSANKAIVVITHNTENLSIFDKIIFLSKGRPTFVGTYEQLLLDYKTSDRYMIRKYMDMNIAEVYQELNASTRIYKI